jgi:hypothetical protein
MSDDRRPIEPLIRAESAPDDAVVVMRGAPIAAEKIVEHAVRQQALFTYLGQPMMAISVYLAVSGWTVDSILRERMRTRSRYATALVGSLRRAGYDLVPTGQLPHFSLVLPGITPGDAAALLAHFGPTLENPYRARR